MSNRAVKLKAPFPWPGGKARVADLVWERLGNVDNFCEPFAGSLAVTLRRPPDHFKDGYRVETVNDANHYLVNFWRAVANAPAEVARWADWPVAEADLHARHKWLVRSAESVAWRKKMATDPDHYDAKIAGWWCWGQCAWIGGAWCTYKVDQRVLPLLDSSQKGVHSAQGEDPAGWVQTPELSSGAGRVIHASPDTSHKLKMPNLGQECGTGGVGVHGVGGRPQLADAYDIGRGVNSGGAVRGDTSHKLKMPGIGGDHPGSSGLRGVVANPTAGTVSARRAWLTDWMGRLSDRLRLVRTCYGHWSRICDSDSTLTRLGTTGVFLDPPYPARRADTGEHSRDANLYATDVGADLDALRDEVLGWCHKWGSDPAIRIAVCGYEGDGYEALEAVGWSVNSWEASGGYANQRRAGKGKSANAARERIWFSPGCVKPNDCPLFDHLGA